MTQTDTFTHQTECSTWTTKVVGNFAISFRSKSVDHCAITSPNSVVSELQNGVRRASASRAVTSSHTSSPSSWFPVTGRRHDYFRWSPNQRPSPSIPFDLSRAPLSSSSRLTVAAVTAGIARGTKTVARPARTIRAVQVWWS